MTQTKARPPCNPIVEAGVVVGCECGTKMKRGDSWISHANRRAVYAPHVRTDGHADYCPFKGACSCKTVPPPLPMRCHGAAGCSEDAIGHVRMKGLRRMWVPVCGRHVGPWTIQGAKYVGPT